MAGRCARAVGLFLVVTWRRPWGGKLLEHTQEQPVEGQGKNKGEGGGGGGRGRRAPRRGHLR